MAKNDLSQLTRVTGRLIGSSAADHWHRLVGEIDCSEALIGVIDYRLL